MYAQIPFWPFMLAVVIVAAPLAVIRDEWAWRYVLLILLMFVVINYRGVQAFSNFLGRSIRVGG